jgi:hypothetical protein
LFWENIIALGIRDDVEEDALDWRGGYFKALSPHNGGGIKWEK